MPLIASASVDLRDPVQTTGSVSIIPLNVLGSAAANLSGPISLLLLLKQIDASVDASGFLSLFEVEFSTTSPLALHNTSLDSSGTLRDFEIILDLSTPLALVVGSVPPTINPFRVSTSAIQVQSYHILFQRQSVSLRDRLMYGYGPLVTVSGGVSAEDDIILVDLLGPQIFNEVPLAYSSFNNPNTDVTFDLIDTGGSDISLSGTQIYVDGTLVIDAGADVTPSGFGVTSFTPVSNSFYQFSFSATTPYSPDSEITVSGRSSDTTPSGNVEYFNYNFKVWKTDNLNASITGLADTFPPFLENLDPAIFQAEVPVDTNILLTINDLHTGVDIDSIILSVGQETVFSGSQGTSPYYDILRTTTGDGRGYNFTINPVTDFDFSEQIQINVKASDRFTPINTLDTFYSFYTLANVHLVASGLQVYQDTGYEDMDIASSYTSASSTMFHITYLNLQGTGLSTSGSSVLLDGIEIPSTITAISGNPLAYDVFFELQPDYTDDADLTFHVQQSGTVSGSIISRDFLTELLWGYEFCYDNDILPHDTELNYVVRVCDNGTRPALSAFVKSFTTVPLDSNRLLASIYPINPPSQDITAYLQSNNPFFEYGKTLYLELDVSDFSGNKRTFAWKFTIEDE